MQILKEFCIQSSQFITIQQIACGGPTTKIKQRFLRSDCREYSKSPKKGIHTTFIVHTYSINEIHVNILLHAPFPVSGM